MKDFGSIQAAFDEMVGYPPVKEVDLKDAKVINKHYAECLLLANGKIVELSGSHETTAAKGFKENPEEIPANEYGFGYGIKKYRVAFIHSRDHIQAGVLTQLQRQTIQRMINRGLLDDSYTKKIFRVNYEIRFGGIRLWLEKSYEQDMPKNACEVGRLAN